MTSWVSARSKRKEIKNMTFEEFKSTLMSSQQEGADVATVFDSVLTEASGLYTSIGEKDKKIEELVNRVTTLTDNNLKLLDKVKYMGQDGAGKPGTDPDQEKPEITIDNLFEEE